MTINETVNFFEVGALYKDKLGRKWEIRKNYGEHFMVGITANTPTFREAEVRGISIEGLERVGVRNLLKEVQRNGFRGVALDDDGSPRGMDEGLTAITRVYEL